MPARLFYERIAGSDTAPRRWLALTHGIYGAGSNWRSIARKLNERRPEWGVVLVDLRQHGRSEPGAPPHTIAACAEDLHTLFAELGDVRAIAGHSFGGKVVLAARRLAWPSQTWVLDASPSRRDADPSNTVMRVLEIMERAPRGWARREDFVAALVGHGHDEGLARWLAMSLQPEPAGTRAEPIASGPQRSEERDHLAARVSPPGGTLALRFDFAALREMLADYYAADLWDALEAPGGDVEVAVAERSSALSAADLGRLAAAPSHVHVHRIAAGHWLHIDAPALIVDLFASRLP